MTFIIWKKKSLGGKMKYFVKTSMILGTFIIVMGVIKFQENNLKNKTKENKNLQKKQQQEKLSLMDMI